MKTFCQRSEQISAIFIHPSSFAATRDESLCVIANPAFVVYSSIVSFYVPFIITLLVYVQIYVVLRKRRKRVNTKPKQRISQAAEPNVATSLKVSRSVLPVYDEHFHGQMRQRLIHPIALYGSVRSRMMSRSFKTHMYQVKMFLIQCKCEWEYGISFRVAACDSLYETSINNFLKPIRWFYVQALCYITLYRKGENPDRRELIFFKKT